MLSTECAALCGNGVATPLQAQLEKLQKEIEARARQAGIEQLVDPAILESALNVRLRIPSERVPAR